MNNVELLVRIQQQTELDQTPDLSHRVILSSNIFQAPLPAVSLPCGGPIPIHIDRWHLNVAAISSSIPHSLRDLKAYVRIRLRKT